MSHNILRVSPNSPNPNDPILTRVAHDLPADHEAPVLALGEGAHVAVRHEVQRKVRRHLGVTKGG